jgi:LacI family transcriptional regulator
MNTNRANKSTTIYDIAERLDISPATVSRAMGNLGSVRRETRERVLETAQQMGYASNMAASSLRTRRTNTLGVIVPRLNSNFMADVISGIENVASSENFQLIIFQSAESMKNEIAGVRSMLAGRVEGLFVSLAYDTTDTRHYDEFGKRNIPVIFFDRFFDNPHYPNIHIDNYKAGYEITTHLISQGCKRIFHISATGMPSIYRERFEGYRQALADHRLLFENDLLMMNDLSGNSGTAAAQTILQMKNRPDGIFSANDHCAINCLIALKKMGFGSPTTLQWLVSTMIQLVWWLSRT